MLDLYRNRRDKHTEDYKQFTPIGIKEIKAIGKGMLMVNDCDNGEVDYERTYIIPFWEVEKILKNTIGNKEEYKSFYDELFSGNKVLLNFNNGEYFFQEREKLDANKEINKQFDYAVENWIELNEEL